MNNFTAEFILILATALGLTLHAVLLFRSRKRASTNNRPVLLKARWLLLLAGATMVFMPAMDFFYSWFDFADTHYFRPLGWLGLLSGSAAILLYWRAYMDRLQLSRVNQLLDQGIFRHLRHPSHTALMLWAIALTLLLQNWLAGLAAILTFAVVYCTEVPEDEDSQLQQYGHLYLDYMDRTGGIVPHLPYRFRW